MTINNNGTPVDKQLRLDTLKFAAQVVFQRGNKLGIEKTTTEILTLADKFTDFILDIKKES